MAIEYAADEATENVDLDDGESYISANGSKWVSVDTERNPISVSRHSVIIDRKQLLHGR